MNELGKQKQDGLSFHEIIEEYRENAIVYEYVLQLNDMERIALLIAKDHLESSFNLFNSIGFLEWRQKNSK